MAAQATASPVREGAVKAKFREAAASVRDLAEPSPRVIQSDLAAEIRDYLEGLSVDQLLCLAYGHVWPVLIPGQDVPKGFRALPAPETRGVYLITETCTRFIFEAGRRKPALYSCGTARRSMTLPSRVFDRNHHRSYAYDDASWEIRPAGSRLTRLDFLDEIFARMGHALFPEEGPA